MMSFDGKMSGKQTTDSIAEFVKLHPRIYVEELTSTIVNGRIKYVLGARIANDNLVAHSAKNQTWPALQNVAVTLSYPTSGVGKQVTYVAIQVDQTSNFGQAYVTGGGLYQRSISIVVEAYTTKFLNYDAQIYGV
ncbi:hypothetical protein Bhyg_05248 [Pseudolycoriella hygida]|uniref:Uncharacterized protein n=1 Tax=Pseudolycoriella hygida TaxID=35572 RepID=A0A9Q0SAL6_9DIPT|nr:hypothetical protein Bhyg_05248 [Pseudolycoriella hygida]